jgi:hypothetical protein
VRIELDPDGDLGVAVRQAPTVAGVAQLLSEHGASLTIAQAASLRGWATRQLAPPPSRRGRPRLDLRGIARQLALYPTGPGFRRRLVFERLMARHVSPAQRRDLRAPGFLHLDPGERFPRLTVRGGDSAASDLFGPFRDRKAAADARDALHKRVSLRPCDESFEPDPALPLGLGCVYAQVRSCAAPCLARVSEAEYRELALEVEGVLAGDRDEPDAIPAWIGRASARALIAEPAGSGVALFPVQDLAVLDEGAACGPLRTALERVRWPSPDAPLSDAAWLSDWLRSRKRSGAWVRLEDETSLEGAVASALALPERD